MSIYRFLNINQKHQLPAHKARNAGLAFVSGGVIGLFGQVLYEVYTTVFHLSMNDANGWMIITIIFITSLLTGFGVFDRMAQFCGAGTFLPITGFANALVSSAMEGRSEGPIFGIGSNMFKLAGSVITYGVSFALLIAILRMWVKI